LTVDTAATGHHASVVLLVLARLLYGVDPLLPPHADARLGAVDRVDKPPVRFFQEAPQLSLRPAIMLQPAGGDEALRVWHALLLVAPISRGDWDACASFQKKPSPLDNNPWFRYDEFG
jgi:hypothetical protein